MEAEAGTGVMSLQFKECQASPETEEERKDAHLEPSEGTVTLLTPSFFLLTSRT